MQNEGPISRQTVAITHLRQAAEYFERFMHRKAQPAGHTKGRMGIMAYVFNLKRMNPDTNLGFNQRHYVFFKRDWLQTGDRLFNIMSGGPWQSVNLEVLERASNENGVIIVVMPPGQIYAMPAKSWLDYARANGTIRQPSTESGREASVPFFLLTEVKPDMAVEGLTY